MKMCRKCGLPKDFNDFYKHPFGKDGIDSKCKECQKKITSEARGRNPEYYRQYDKDRAMLPHRVKGRRDYCLTDNGRDAHNKAGKKSAEKYPDKKFATTCVANAVRDGRLAKPQNCSICGDSRKRIHGHHDDYSKPLIVKWMCTRCHRTWHLNNTAKRVEGF